MRVWFKGPDGKELSENYMFLCHRHGQCSRPCSEYCNYTGVFEKSKLKHKLIKPVEPVKFILDKHGNWWEIDFERPINLPNSERTNPEQYCQRSYFWLEEKAKEGLERFRRPVK